MGWGGVSFEGGRGLGTHRMPLTASRKGLTGLTANYFLTEGKPSCRSWFGLGKLGRQRHKCLEDVNEQRLIDSDTAMWNEHVA